MQIRLIREEINTNYNFFLALEVYSLGLLAVPLVQLTGFSSKTMGAFVSTYAPLLSIVTILFLFISAVKRQQLTWSLIWMLIFAFVGFAGLALLFVTEDVFQSSYEFFSTLLLLFKTSLTLWWAPVAFMLSHLIISSYLRRDKYDNHIPRAYSLIDLLYKYHFVNFVAFFVLISAWLLLTQGLLPVQLYYIGTIPLITILAIVKIILSILGLLLSILGFITSEQNASSTFLYLLEISFLVLVFYVFGLIAITQ